METQQSFMNDSPQELLKGFSPRLYQKNIAKVCLEKNTLVVLPTGLGKTGIALVVAMQRLKKYPQGKILFLTPTKPLAQQHETTFLTHTQCPVVCLTGAVSPQKRQEEWLKHQIICCTPQGIENDIIANRISLQDVVLLVIDEAHRAVGNYSYTWIAQAYHAQARHERILALSASPGTTKDDVEQVCTNLFIEHIEQRDVTSQDVSSYVQKTAIKYIDVTLPAEYKTLLALLKKALDDRMLILRDLGVSKEVTLSKKEVLLLQKDIVSQLSSSPQSELYTALSVVAQCMKIMHAQDLLETQSVLATKLYLEQLFKDAKTSRVKATQAVAQDVAIKLLYTKLEEYTQEHPKLEALKDLVRSLIKPGKKIIVFNQFRDSIMQIVEHLNTIEGVQAIEFVGQAKKKGSGLSQKEQVARLQEFASGTYNVMVMSSVGEEGLDIPQVDAVVFYEPVPSAIRTIQRKGRTGRHSAGMVYMLVALGTRDEAYKWSSYHKEKKMGSVVSSVDFTPKKEVKKTLHDYEHKPTILVDVREKQRDIIHALTKLGVVVNLQTLQVADYVISADVGVEFKTTHDFIQSLLDGRLLTQALALKHAFSAPLIVVQGEDLFSVRNVHPNAVYGMLTTLMVSYRIPVLCSKNAQETAHILAMLAKKSTSTPVGASVSTSSNVHQALLDTLSTFPGVGRQGAQALLDRFGSVQGICQASIQDLVNVEGIGQKRAEDIYEYVRKVL
ncbi:MAG: ERCC4 domain-containing protein [Candidatus Woesearchaeota archaeon]